jgi:hypothetical protein
MHIQTHIMSGWCMGNLLPFSARERLFCMIAATAPDLDGLGIVVSEHWYTQFHHIVGHNLLFGVVASAGLAALSTRKALGFVTYLALFHLHLFMDYWGSGRDWGICYFWPFQSGPGSWWMNPHGWAFYSWQNITTAFVMLLWTVAIGYVCRRTPLESIMPNLDRRLVGLRENREAEVAVVGEGR